jgi:hypothetical protein
MVKHDFHVLTVPSRPQFGYIDRDPGGATKTFLVGEGRSFKGHLPGDATIALDSKQKGTKLDDFIANSLSWLIVSEEARALLAAEPNPCEVYPLRVLDLKGRPIKTPYFLFHPIGTVDCVDLTKSEYDRSSMAPDMILGFQRVALHQKKIPPARTLFRLKENPRIYIVRSDLLDRLTRAKVTGHEVLDLDTPVFI